MSFVRNCIDGLPSKMKQAIKDADEKLPEAENDSSDEIYQTDYDSMGDDIDSEEKSEDENETMLEFSK